jgi:hypothetical protein
MSVRSNTNEATRIETSLSKRQNRPEEHRRARGLSSTSSTSTRDRLLVSVARSVLLGPAWSCSCVSLQHLQSKHAYTHVDFLTSILSEQRSTDVHYVASPVRHVQHSL